MFQLCTDLFSVSAVHGLFSLVFPLCTGLFSVSVHGSV